MKAQIIDADNHPIEPKKWYQKGWALALTIIAGLAFLGAISFIHVNNEMATAQQQVDEQLGQVQTVIQRRGDLIPNLTNAVKGQQKQERRVYDAIDKARTQYYNAQTSYKQSTNDKQRVDSLALQDKALNILVGSIKEAYPDLKSNQNMNNLMIELEGSENRISVERRKYNQKVNDYNQLLVTFPKSMVASMTNHHQAQYFQATTSAEKTPTVQF